MKEILDIVLRECGFVRRNPVYLLSFLVFPLFCVVFFTSLMAEGQPEDMPVGVVDIDNSSVSRNIVRRLDAMQSSRVVAHYPSVSDARKAVQRGEIYAFLYIPEGLKRDMLSSRQPRLSFYYSSTSLTAGALLYRDMKTVTTLASAAVGQATLSAKGFTPREAMTFLQPVALDAHLLNNPFVNYNVYLSTILVPGCILLFVMLLTAYSLGSELKRRTAAQLLSMAGGNVSKAIFSKLLLHTALFLFVMYAHYYVLYCILHFPHSGSVSYMLALGLLTVLAGQGFGLLAFAIVPSMRLSMSVCSLLSVLSFSMAGAAFPVFSMDAPLEALAWLFPLRHYWMVYSLNIFNGYPLSDTWPYFAMLLLFALLPLLFLRRLRRIFTTFVYTA